MEFGKATDNARVNPTGEWTSAAHGTDINRFKRADCSGRRSHGEVIQPIH